jgi:hypothetical protein
MYSNRHSLNSTFCNLSKINPFNARKTTNGQNIITFKKKFLIPNSTREFGKEINVSSNLTVTSNQNGFNGRKSFGIPIEQKIKNLKKEKEELNNKLKNYKQVVEIRKKKLEHNNTLSYKPKSSNGKINMNKTTTGEVFRKGIHKLKFKNQSQKNILGEDNKNNKTMTINDDVVMLDENVNPNIVIDNSNTVYENKNDKTKNENIDNKINDNIINNSCIIKNRNSFNRKSFRFLVSQTNKNLDLSNSFSKCYSNSKKKSLLSPGKILNNNDSYYYSVTGNDTESNNESTYYNNCNEINKNRQNKYNTNTYSDYKNIDKENQILIFDEINKEKSSKIIPRKKYILNAFNTQKYNLLKGEQRKKISVLLSSSKLNSCLDNQPRNISAISLSGINLELYYYQEKIKIIKDKIRDYQKCSKEC